MKATVEAKPVTMKRKNKLTRVGKALFGGAVAVSSVAGFFFAVSYAPPVLEWALDKMNATEFKPTAEQSQFLESCELLKTHGLPVTLDTVIKQYLHDSGKKAFPLAAVPNIYGELEGDCMTMYVPPVRSLGEYVADYKQGRTGFRTVQIFSR